MPLDLEINCMKLTSPSNINVLTSIYAPHTYTAGFSGLSGSGRTSKCYGRVPKLRKPLNVSLQPSRLRDTLQFGL